MRRVVFLYGAACYSLFFAIFLYVPGFLANRWVPKSIDSGAEGALLPALGVNVALLSLFALQHSIMARPWFKQWLSRLVAPPAERSTYVLASSLCMVLLFSLWQPMTGVVWRLEHPVANAALLGLLFGGWGLVFLATCLLDHFELFGLRQVYDHLRGRESRPATFASPGLYRWVRHPIYVGWLLFFWATPEMTVGHLLFAGVTTAYILVAIPLEERDLVGVFGERYRAYQTSTPALVPALRMRRGGLERTTS